MTRTTWLASVVTVQNVGRQSGGSHFVAIMLKLNHCQITDCLIADPPLCTLPLGRLRSTAEDVVK